MGPVGVGAVMRTVKDRVRSVLGSVARGRSGTYHRAAGGLRSTEEIRRLDHRRGKEVGLIVGTGLSVYVAVETLGNAEGPPSGVEIESGLDPEVERYAEMSPFLREELARLRAEGWEIGYGDIDSLGVTLGGEKKIVIDTDMREDPLWATAILAHEVGHAYPGAYHATTDAPGPGEKFGTWLERNMRQRDLGEAESGLTTAQARREILARGGPDIGNVDDEIVSIYERQRAGELSRADAQGEVADFIGSRPYEHYVSELERLWDENYADSHGPSEPRDRNAEPGSDGGDAVPGKGLPGLVGGEGREGPAGEPDTDSASSLQGDQPE
ncbi:hypothetical protein [Nocardia sp. NPDC024068]|uniref:hypothetical protein n=1 Tax=Nocardia sp. NPDC024068 TaxID=3157197 RepID=UPI003410F402